jgi:hypothetical protein
MNESGSFFINNWPAGHAQIRKLRPETSKQGKIMVTGSSIIHPNLNRHMLMDRHHSTDWTYE